MNKIDTPMLLLSCILHPSIAPFWGYLLELPGQKFYFVTLVES